MKWALLFAVGLASLASQAQADRVHLVGGSVIEGKATRVGRKVIVEIESGELTLSADSVERIEAAESDVQRFEARYEKLKPGDIQGLMELADFCRDHEMRAREQQMLEKVIELAPDHKDARARLGYVHTDNGWLTHDDYMRSQGFVLHDGQWITRVQLIELERAQAQADTAARERDKAQVELEQKRLELEKARASKDATPPSPPAPVPQPVPPYANYAPYITYTPYSIYSPYASYAGRAFPHCWDGHCTRPTPPVHQHVPFPIPGVRDPFDYMR
jgi:hypothetical protein